MNNLLDIANKYAELYQTKGGYPLKDVIADALQEAMDSKHASAADLQDFYNEAFQKGRDAQLVFFKGTWTQYAEEQANDPKLKEDLMSAILKQQPISAAGEELKRLYEENDNLKNKIKRLDESNEIYKITLENLIRDK